MLNRTRARTGAVTARERGTPCGGGALPSGLDTRAALTLPVQPDLLPTVLSSVGVAVHRRPRHGRVASKEGCAESQGRQGMADARTRSGPSGFNPARRSLSFHKKPPAFEA